MKLLYVKTGHAPSLRITEEKYFFLWNIQMMAQRLRIFF